MVLEAFMTRSVKDLFKAWHLVFKKDYSFASDEAKIRFKNFKENYAKIKEHNAKNLEYTVGLNQFSDMSNEEFRSKFATYRHDTNTDKFVNTWQEKLPEENNSNSFLPVTGEDDDEDLLKRNLQARSAIDYRNYYNAPRNQQNCGGCWAFSITGAIEGAKSRKQGWINPYLSVQQLLDCNKQNYGCNGGDLVTGMGYALYNGGQNDSDYSYLGYSGNNCLYNKSRPLTNLNGYQYCNNLTTYKCSTQTVYNLLQKGPLSVVTNGGSWAFQNYSGGILTAACNTIDHAVVIVGYGVSGNIAYWLVRNSWGPYWGEQGYLRIAINPNNNSSCYLEYMAVLPTL